MSQCEILKSKRGKDILISEGFSYHLNKRRDNKYYWRCTRKSSTRCNVSVTSLLTTNNLHVVLSQNHDHTHLPDPEKRHELQLKANLKEKAHLSLDSPAQIIQRCKQSVPSTSSPQMPKKEAMRKMIQRERNKNLPSIPQDLISVVIPEEFTKLDSDEPFLIGSFVDNSVIIFSTKENLKLLSKANFWMMDGTFNCCPVPFCQIYTIHAMVGTPDSTHKIVPLVYGLLANKSERCYTIFLQILKSVFRSKLNESLQPKIILTDFELAAMNAIKKVFPSCLNKLCFFHLNQSIYRHIQEAGLASRYNNDAVFAHKMRHIGALAFLEPNEIIDALEILKNDIIPHEATVVIEWFEKYYINGSMVIKKTSGSKIALKRCHPKFPPHLWSIHDSIVSHVPLSQNALESWHNRWNTLLNRRKWNIFKTITEFKKEQKNTEDIIERIKSSEPMAKRKCESKDYKERIHQHISEKNKMDLKSYLNGWAHICHLIK
ncbi:hypothetical protein ABMA28_013911 [Loxostege sticticalis]|uniref:MULE transposase domain-containing protein n=1 Tax=Loxostege sticticalis TaxID=481309 RepID=A0ABD0TJZ4_LOXSC